MILVRLLVFVALVTTALPAWAQLAQIDLPITFDDPTVDYTVTDFEGNDTTLVPDPFDGSNTVASTVKPIGAQPFAGTTAGTFQGLASPIPFTASETTMRVRVFAPNTNVPIRLKVDDAFDPARTAQTETLTTTADAWETLTFDFANPVPGTPPLNLTYTYNQVSIFFDYGNEAFIDQTYLWDDVAFGDGSGPAVPSISPLALSTIVPGLLVGVGWAAMRRRSA